MSQPTQQELLHMALAASATESADSPSAQQSTMRASAADLQWLRAALDENLADGRAAGGHPLEGNVSVIRAAARRLVRHVAQSATPKSDGGGRDDGNDDDEEQQRAPSDDETLEALELTQERVEDLDKAQVFFQLGGFVPTLTLLRYSPVASIRSEAAFVLSSCVQNQLPLQRAALDVGTLELVTELLDSETEDRVGMKLIGLLACLVRGSTRAVNELVDTSGALEALVHALATTEHLRTLRKTLFFLVSLLQGGATELASGDASGLGAATERVRARLIELRVDETLSGNQEHGDVDVRELSAKLGVLLFNSGSPPRAPVQVNR